MAKDDLDDLEKKKQELEQQLDKIHDELDNSLEGVRRDVSKKINPKEIIRKHPLPLVGGAALVGFLLGHNDRAKGKSSTEDVKAALFTALKKMATRKAISFATDYIEEMIEEKAEEHLSSQ